MLKRTLFKSIALILLTSSPAFADSGINSGDTAWMIVSTVGKGRR